MKSIIIAFSGKPGSGKSTLSKIISERLNAVYLRIDTIEWFLNDKCKIKVGIKDYEFSQVIALDNLRIGNIIVSDGCNYSEATRNGWEEVAKKANCKCLNVEVVCSDNNVRRNRLAERHSNLSSDVIDEIMKEPFEEWTKERLIIDTSSNSIDDCVSEIIEIVNREINVK